MDAGAGYRELLESDETNGREPLIYHSSHGTGGCEIDKAATITRRKHPILYLPARVLLADAIPFDLKTPGSAYYVGSEKRIGVRMQSA